MEGAVRAPRLDDMPTIVIAGGGIAGLEALIALHGHLGSTARIELLEGNTDLVERQRAVAEPFGGAPARHFDLVRIAADHGAHLRPDRLASVDTEARRVRTVRGDTLDYDALLIAVGATPDMAIPGALTFTGPRDVGAFSALLADLDAGRVQRVAFAVPGSVTWTLPLYELALMTGERVRSRGLEDVGLMLVTPEHSPLEAFGARIASHIRSLLVERDIAVCTHSVPLRAGPGGLIVAHREPVQAQRIVSLPRLVGPWIGGMPHDGDGFLPTDEDGAVLPGRKVRDVLQQNGTRFHSLDHVDKAPPHLRAGIVGRTLPRLDQAPELGLPGPGKGLAGNAASDQVDLSDAPRVKVIQEVLRVGKIPLISESAKIGDMRLNRRGVVIRPNEHSKASLLQTEAEASGPAEEVDGSEPELRLGLHPATHCREIKWIGHIRGRGQPQLVPTEGPHRNTG